MSDEPDLLPCPFCGGEASPDGRITYSPPLKDTWWPDGSEVTEAFFCNCTECGVSNRAALTGRRTRAEAIEHWNRRAQQLSKLDITKPVQTDLGEPARALGELLTGQIVAAVKIEAAEYERPFVFQTDGKGVDTVRRLINVPQRHVRWVNVYEGNYVKAGYLYKSVGEADENADKSRLACIRIEFEEGEGLE